MRVVASRSSTDRTSLSDGEGLAPFDPMRIEEEGADVHLSAIANTNEVVARCSLWWSDVPPLESYRVGVVGHYASANDKSAAVLLESVLDHLRHRYCTVAIGPMDGNTWRSYRFVTERGSEAPFVMEPTNPPEWPLQFERAGFARLAEYFSALNTNIQVRDMRVAQVAARLAERGITIRAAERTALQDEIGRIYQLSRVAFTRNFLYTPVTEEAFRTQYAKVLPHVVPDLVLLAERGGELAGYLFAIPDLAQAARGSAVDTFVIKTVAILPDADLRGLGTVLVARAHEAGARMGFARCIHALMHESNVSRNISNHYASTMRRYTLFSKEIAP